MAQGGNPAAPSVRARPIPFDLTYEVMTRGVAMPHMPGHFRQAFDEWVTEGMNTDVVDDLPVRSLLGRLARCSDLLPWDVRYALGLPRGSTYAGAVRMIRPEFEAKLDREIHDELE